MGGIEYVYDGGLKTVNPGMTHLGRPFQILPLGQTSLPMDVIMEYLESLREIYTYDVCALLKFRWCNGGLLGDRLTTFGPIIATTSRTTLLPS